MAVGNPLDPAKTISSFHLCNLCSARYYYAEERDVTKHSTKTKNNSSDRHRNRTFNVFCFFLRHSLSKTFDKVGSFFFLLNMTYLTYHNIVHRTFINVTLKGVVPLNILNVLNKSTL